jgi:vacuolar-type H+-ATPase subunit E/Vma4
MIRIVRSIETFATRLETAKQRLIVDKCALRNASTSLREAEEALKNHISISEEAARKFLQTFREYVNVEKEYEQIVSTQDANAIDVANQRLYISANRKCEAHAKLTAVNKELDNAVNAVDDSLANYKEALDEFDSSEMEYTITENCFQKAVDEFNGGV